MEPGISGILDTIVTTTLTGPIQKITRIVSGKWWDPKYDNRQFYYLARWKRMIHGNAHLKTDGSFSPHHWTNTTAFMQGSLCHTISSTFMVKWPFTSPSISGGKDRTCTCSCFLFISALLRLNCRFKWPPHADSEFTHANQLSSTLDVTWIQRVSKPSHRFKSIISHRVWRTESRIRTLNRVARHVK